MARQSLLPVSYNHTSRVDNVARRTSARAGEVVLVDYIPVLRGDSVGGQVAVDIVLAHMPRRPLNSIVANVQAWFVPKSIHPQFSGMDEFLASYHGEPIKSLGAADRNPPSFYNVLSGAARTAALSSDHFKTLGVSLPASVDPNDDLFDAYTIVHNFRLRAHSTKIPRRAYMREDTAIGSSFARAFWPENRYSRVVPDYERALVVGQMSLDVQAGQLPVSGIGFGGALPTFNDVVEGGVNTVPGTDSYAGKWTSGSKDHNMTVFRASDGTAPAETVPLIFAEMAETQIVASIADVDKARVTQAMAKARTSMAGNNITGFDQENAILADLMQGLRVDPSLINRPFLLGNQMVPFAMAERWATDGASLEQSDTRGTASARIPVNLPVTDTGGLIVVICEVVPERIYERQGDPFFALSDTSQLPDALRDVQRVEPVDIVPNWRIDATHTAPNGTYGYEPMNDSWNREFTALGGDYYQPTAGDPTPSAARDAIWTAEIIDPAYNADHFLVPADFPHDIFSDTAGSAFDVIVRRAAVVRGLTQIGDVLAEDNSDWDAVVSEDE